VLPFAAAGLIHFGALPIAAVIFLVTRRRFDWRLVAAGLVGLFVFIYYLSELLVIDAYLDSLTVKIEEYTNRSDGAVTLTQEIRLFLYWSAAILMFRFTKPNLAIAYVLVYLAYLVSFQNDLYHLRYHKFLEAMAWPSAFILFCIKREATGYILVSALAYRIYKYITLLAPESGAPSMVRMLLFSLISYFSWLSSS
jgi:hypothetical protein